jgi:hypothetical protein
MLAAIRNSSSQITAFIEDRNAPNANALASETGTGVAGVPILSPPSPARCRG